MLWSLNHSKIKNSYLKDKIYSRVVMPNHLIAIIGRPNVGKSTFFNRLLKKRKAIVGSQEGITRDRLYGDIDWSGHSLTFIDTGGS